MSVSRVSDDLPAVPVLAEVCRQSGLEISDEQVVAEKREKQRVRISAGPSGCTALESRGGRQPI